MTQTNTQIDWPRLARLALTSRSLDIIEEQELAPIGKIAYQFSARGHELSQLLVGLALTHPRDAVMAYYRSRPLVMALGATLDELLAGGMAKHGGHSDGRDAGVLHFFASRGGATAPPPSGDVGAQYSPAAGWAQAITYHRDVLKDAEWSGAIAVAHGGDGSVAANGFWAALNIATTQRLPLLFFIEDNGYAISVPSARQYPSANIADDLACFHNLKIIQADGTDPASAPAAVHQAIAHVRSGAGPCLLRLAVPRISGHSLADNQAYKSAEQRAQDEARDPLPRLRAHLPEVDWNTLAEEVEAEIRAAVEAALNSPEPDPAQVRRHVFYEGRAPRVGGLLPAVAAGQYAPLPAGDDTPRPAGPRINLLDAVRRVLESELALNPRALVFGEDVGAKGGVHGATVDLQMRFGEARVFDTSLSEEGIVGRAVGLGYAGLLPIPEIQFRKYADPAMEPLTDCGWIRWRTSGQFCAPMVVRMPVGLGRKSHDPFHSVSGESAFARLIGWRIAFPSNAEDAVGLLRHALRCHDPVLFLEHRALLDTPAARRPYPGDDYVLPFGRAAVAAAGDELTVVAWGEMVHRCLEAAQASAGRVEVIDLRTLSPWDREAVLTSVRKTGKCLVVHEDTITSGFAGEIIATIASEAFEHLDAPVARLATYDCPIPYNPGLMRAVVPAVDDIAAKIAGLLAY